MLVVDCHKLVFVRPPNELSLQMNRFFWVVFGETLDTAPMASCTLSRQKRQRAMTRRFKFPSSAALVQLAAEVCRTIMIGAVVEKASG